MFTVYYKSRLVYIISLHLQCMFIFIKPIFLAEIQFWCYMLNHCIMNRSNKSIFGISLHPKKSKCRCEESVLIGQGLTNQTAMYIYLQRKVFLYKKKVLLYKKAFIPEKKDLFNQKSKKKRNYIKKRFSTFLNVWNKKKRKKKYFYPPSGIILKKVGKSPGGAVITKFQNKTLKWWYLH